MKSSFYGVKLRTAFCRLCHFQSESGVFSFFLNVIFIVSPGFILPFYVVGYFVYVYFVYDLIQK